MTQPLNAQFARGDSDRRYCWAPMVSIWTQIEEIGSSSSFLWVLVPQIMQSFFYLINASELEPSQLILIFLSSIPTILQVPESLWHARTKRVNPKGRAQREHSRKTAIALSNRTTMTISKRCRFHLNEHMKIFYLMYSLAGVST